MKNLKKDIKKILSNECLSEKEKVALKKIFKDFALRRNILSRNTIDFEHQEEQCFGLDSILRNS